jgi:hypothetical protein
VFQGATNINFDSTGTSVTNLAATTTVKFNGTASDITVGAAGASASVALSNVAESAVLNVGGSKLGSVTVSGTRADTDSSGSVAAQTLNVTMGKDVQTLTLNTNQKTTLAVTEDGATTKHLTTIDASASTGALTIDGTGMTTLANVTTGTGNDTVTINATTSAATSSAAAVNASVTTGDGNDTITVNTTGDGKTTVDAGAGNDKITVSAGVGQITVQGGAGNDTVVIQKVLATTDVINGGDGTDTISFAGADARTADDYIVFNKMVTGFETISFSSAETGLDASKLAATYTTIDLATGSAITGVGTQAITAHGDVGLTAAGYSTGSSGTTYAGTVGVTESTTGNVTVNADVLNLTVKAGTVDTVATLLGDVRTANITLTNANNGASGSSAADTFANLSLDTHNSDAALKTLTLTGNGTATVHNDAGTALVTVDASGLGGTLALGSNAGAVTGGLHYTSDNAKAETIKLGSGIDNVTLNASTFDAVDTVTGLKLVLNSAGTDLAAGSDVLNVGGVTGLTSSAKFTTTQTDLELALKDAAAATATKGANLVFQLGGDTYVFHDDGNHVINSGDTVVKLTGAIDLDTLIISLNHGLV